MNPADAHEPPPPTEREQPLGVSPTAPESPSGAPGPAPAKKGKAGIILGILTGILLVLGSLAAGAYFFLWRYEATARAHLPENTEVAIRVENADILLFKPVREHIWPVLEKRKGKKKGSRVDLIKKETGIDLEKDVREIIFASADGSSWVVLLGGKLEHGRVVSGLEKVFEKEGLDSWEADGDYLRGPLGIIITQAEDGTVIIGSGDDVVQSALPESEHADELRLAEEGAVAFAISKKAIKSVRKAGGPLTAGGALEKISSVTGTVTLGDEPRIDVDIKPRKKSEAEELSEEVQDLIQDARLLLFLAKDVAGEKKALRDAEVEVKGSRVHVTVPWPYDALDKACEDLAESLSLVLPRE